MALKKWCVLSSCNRSFFGINKRRTRSLVFGWLNVLPETCNAINRGPRRRDAILLWWHLIGKFSLGSVSRSMNKWILMCSLGGDPVSSLQFHSRAQKGFLPTLRQNSMHQPLTFVIRFLSPLFSFHQFLTHWIWRRPEFTRAQSEDTVVPSFCLSPLSLPMLFEHVTLSPFRFLIMKIMGDAACNFPSSRNVGEVTTRQVGSSSNDHANHIYSNN